MKTKKSKQYVITSSREIRALAKIHSALGALEYDHHRARVIRAVMVLLEINPKDVAPQ